MWVTSVDVYKRQEKSLAAYLKAYDLDKGNASTLKKVQEGVTTLYNAYKQVGDNNYTQRSMPAAAAAFGKAYDLTKGGIIDVPVSYTHLGDPASGSTRPVRPPCS